MSTAIEQLRELQDFEGKEFEDYTKNEISEYLEEVNKQRANKIYDDLLREKIYAPPSSDAYTELREDLGKSKFLNLVRSDKSNPRTRDMEGLEVKTLDHWASKYNVSVDQLIDLLREADYKEERRRKAVQLLREDQRRIEDQFYDHYGLDQLDPNDPYPAKPPGETITDDLEYWQDINQVEDPDQLTQIQGIGPVTAKEILSHKPYYAFTGETFQLSQVKGVGPKTLKQLKKWFIVDGEPKLVNPREKTVTKSYTLPKNVTDKYVNPQDRSDKWREPTDYTMLDLDELEEQKEKQQEEPEPEPKPAGSPYESSGEGLNKLREITLDNSKLRSYTDELEDKTGIQLHTKQMVRLAVRGYIPVHEDMITDYSDLQRIRPTVKEDVLPIIKRTYREKLRDHPEIKIIDTYGIPDEFEGWNISRDDAGGRYDSSDTILNLRQVTAVSYIHDLTDLGSGPDFMLRYGIGSTPIGDKYIVSRKYGTKGLRADTGNYADNELYGDWRNVNSPATRSFDTFWEALYYFRDVITADQTGHAETAQELFDRVLSHESDEPVSFFEMDIDVITNVDGIGQAKIDYFKENNVDLLSIIYHTRKRSFEDFQGWSRQKGARVKNYLENLERDFPNRRDAVIDAVFSDLPE